MATVRITKRAVDAARPASNDTTSGMTSFRALVSKSHQQAGRSISFNTGLGDARAARVASPSANTAS